MMATARKRNLNRSRTRRGRVGNRKYVCRTATEYIGCTFEETEQVDETRNGMTIDGHEMKELECFKYLAIFVQKHGVFVENVSRRIRCELGEKRLVSCAIRVFQRG